MDEKQNMFQPSYKNEKWFQTDYIKYLKDEWYWVYKFPDVWFTLKPFDIIAIRPWEVKCIELKYGRVDTYDKIYKMLRPNQVWWLLHTQEHWCDCYVVWWDKKENKIYEYKFKYKKYEWAL